MIYEGEAIEELEAPYKGEDGIYIPSTLATKYFVVTDKDILASEIKNLGFEVYINEELGVVSVGNTGIDDSNAEETVKSLGIYVSPDGSDENPGYASSPVKTLSRAKEVYEKAYQGEVLVHGGEYRESLSLTSTASGIVISPYGDGEVKLKGSVSLPVSEFTDVRNDSMWERIPASARDRVFVIDLSDYVSGDMPEYPEYTPQLQATAYYELFHDGEAKTIARWPNEGFQLTEGVSGNSFTVSEEKAELWKNSGRGMICGYFAKEWAFENIYIDSVASGDSVITLSKTPKYGLEEGQRFYAMNMIEELDTAGEYYIDPVNKKLYYYPEGGVIAGELSLSIKTSPLITVAHATDVTINGITVEETRGKAITVTGGSNVEIDGAVIRNIGSGAVEIASTDSIVKNCDIYNIGGTAVRITAGSNDSLKAGNTRAVNNRIHDFGRIFRTYQGALNINGCGNVAEFNTIYNAPHCAVRFTGSNHSINNNEIYNVVYESSDAGAIYAGRTWTAWGNRITEIISMTLQEIQRLVLIRWRLCIVTTS